MTDGTSISRHFYHDIIDKERKKKVGTFSFQEASKYDVELAGPPVKNSLSPIIKQRGKNTHVARRIAMQNNNVDDRCRFTSSGTFIRETCPVRKRDVKCENYREHRQTI